MKNDDTLNDPSLHVRLAVALERGKGMTKRRDDRGDKRMLAGHALFLTPAGKTHGGTELFQAQPVPSNGAEVTVLSREPISRDFAMEDDEKKVFVITRTMVKVCLFSEPDLQGDPQTDDLVPMVGYVQVSDLL